MNWGLLLVATLFTSVLAAPSTEGPVAEDTMETETGVPDITGTGLPDVETDTSEPEVDQPAHLSMPDDLPPDPEDPTGGGITPGPIETASIDPVLMGLTDMAETEHIEGTDETNAPTEAPQAETTSA